MRGQRLFRLAEHLRAVEETTVPALADALGVSIRTIHRDIALLRDEGFQIAADPGRGGGVRLERPRGTVAVHFSLEEIVGLWLAARLSQGSSGLPWSTAANAAMRKLFGTLPPNRRGELRSLCRRVFVGPPATAKVRESAASYDEEVLRVFEEAFSRNTALLFSYADRDGTKSRRRVEPHGLLIQWPVWYVLARDVAKGAPRMFRMDRISRSRTDPSHRFAEDATTVAALVPDGANWHPLIA